MATTRNQINLRIDAQQQDLIDRAAQSVGKSRTEFILDATRREATAVLLDQSVFMMDEESYDRFQVMLDAPAIPTQALRDLLAEKSPWE
ncbi:MAG: DUF1778 domain-containing protein [Thermomicrobiales bacterium]|nr:DUF1778 domain-containing protein [Thermomicrobiales bacterium]